MQVCYASRMAHKFSDRLTMPTGLPSPERRPNGSWIVWMVLATPGVMDYPEHGRVYVPPETLSDQAWLDAIPGATLTIDDIVAHAEGTTLDDPTRIGTMLDAQWDEAGQRVIGRAIVDSREGLEAILSGVDGCSPAYEADADPPGGLTPEGEQYDKIQRNRRGVDNVAITTKPRGGASARLQVDAKTGDSMTLEEVIAAVGELKTQLEAMGLKLDGMAPKVEEPEPMEDAPMDPTVDEVAALKDVADAEGVEMKPGDKVADSFLAVGRKLVGEERGKTLTADSARDLVVSTARIMRERVADGRWPRGKLTADADQRAAGDLIF